jgi:hypothetical protein
VEAPYRHWWVDLFFLCLIVPLSWSTYRAYRKGSWDSFSAKFLKSERRVATIGLTVFFISLAVLQIILKWLGFLDHGLPAASVWLVLGADSWRRYLELKRAEVSSLQ